jgi:predicted MFS family arabinose efflux permease
MSPRGGFAALIVADIVSALGSRISLVAIPWLVLTTTGSPTDMGLVSAAEMIPYLLSSALLTPVADRVGLRTTSVFCDVASAVTVGCIAAFQHDGLGWLLLLVAVAGALRGIGDRTKHVLLRPAAQAAGYSMIRVTSVYEGLTRLATLLGAPLGGLLIYWFGARGAVWVDAASFGCCALLLTTLVPGLKPIVAEPGTTLAAREPYLVALRGGLRYLQGDRLLFTMLVIVFGLNIFANAGTVIFIPVWVSDVLHSPEALGSVLGVFAGGALLGNLIFTVVAQRLPRYPAFLVGALLSGAPRLVVLAVSDNLALVLVITFLSGVGIASVNPILGVAMYERVPDALQTRVIGLCTTVTFAGIPIGSLVGGWSVSRFGLHDAVLGAAVLCLAVTLGPLLGQRRLLPASAGRP